MPGTVPEPAAPLPRDYSPVALLVDGDNASPSLIAEILAETSRYGNVELRRVYGDWASGRFASWRAIVQDHALVPVQQFANVAGKNATDSALIIDAMDLLHEGRFRAFCIVSSDSDYTRLATRMRESGVFVIGVGRAQTPAPFRNACNVFVSTENLSPRASARPAPAGPSPAAGGAGTRANRPSPATGRAAPPPPPPETLDLLAKAFDSVVRPDGYATLGELGAAVLRLDPSFDPRSFGRSKLADLLESWGPWFEVRRPPRGTGGALLVRLKPRRGD